MEGLSLFLRRLDPRAFDAAAALALSLVAIAIVAGREAGGVFRPDDAAGLALALAQTLPLAFRRRAPLGAAVIISAALIAHSALGYQIVQAGTFASLIAVYGAAVLCERRESLLALVLALAAIAGFFATNREGWTAAEIVATGATWTAVWLIGAVVRIRGGEAQAAEARATRLEREQEARAREAVADERARMARELHDFVGHALNVIVLQAAGARRALGARPEAVPGALSAIETTGRAALGDMERMLGVLRPAAAGDGDAVPQPGLAQLDELIAHVREAGIAVALRTEGAPAAVPASVDLSAYRIIQESLTNALKHSGARRAEVTVRYRPQDIEVSIVDDGRAAGAAAPPEGRGHLGMRERVALFGGEIAIGPRPGAPGFAVTARLPLGSPAP